MVPNDSRRHRIVVPSVSLVLLLVAPGLLVPLAAGCAMRTSVDDLQSQNDELERRNFELRKELAEARVRQSMSGGAPRGATGTTQGPVEGGGSAQAAPPESEPLDAAPQAAGVVYSEPITEVPQGAAAPPASSGRQASARTGSAAAELMRSARGRLDAKDPDAALAAFREIVARHPEDALADDAQFGAGECYFVMGRYAEAIGEYQAVIERFPYGDQVPFAFLKIGFAHLAMEHRDQALDSFKTVSQAYPGTEAATVARQQIAHLKASP